MMDIQMEQHFDSPFPTLLAAIVVMPLDVMICHKVEYLQELIIMTIILLLLNNSIWMSIARVQQLISKYQKRKTTFTLTAVVSATSTAASPALANLLTQPAHQCNMLGNACCY